MKNLKALVRRLIEAKLDPGQQRIPLAQASAMCKHLITGMGLKYVDPSSVNTQTRFVAGVGIPVGSVRRQKGDVGDIDIVVTAPVSRADVARVKGVENVTGGAKQINFVYNDSGESRKVNVFVFTNPDTFGAALLHTTGPHMYNVRLRRKAITMGFKLSQNGLVDEDDNLIAGETEFDVQDALEVTKREPRQR